MTLQHNTHDSAVSLYIHWPFCLNKCPYCDFNSHVTKNRIDSKIWLEAYLRQIDLFSLSLKDKKIKSIYFGGGTPSLMPVEIAVGIIEYLSKLYDITDAEITLEANPTSVEKTKFIDFYSAGVNRISIGVQALDEKRLKFLGRQHNVKEALEAIEIAHKYFKKFSFDLIYATPDHNIENWGKELQRALELAGDHISLYQLTIEPKTKFFQLYKIGKLSTISDAIGDQLYTYTKDILLENGYKHYEISNYAKKSAESLHNLAYWHYNDYIGIGPGAHSRISFHRNFRFGMQAIEMEKQPFKWLEKSLDRSFCSYRLEILDEEEILTEILLMGLRMKDGISDNKIRKFLNQNLEDVCSLKNLQKLAKLGLIQYSKHYIRTTDKGQIVLNSILTELLLK